MQKFQFLTKQEPRILFGASDSLTKIPAVYPFFRRTTSFNTKQLAIQARISAEPSLEDLFEPVYDCYYDGPMGGYGANLKAIAVGFCVSKPMAIRQVLALRQMDVAMICTEQDFQRLIETTPIMTRVVALVTNYPVMRTELTKCNSVNQQVFAVMYERHQHVDVLYLYDSPIVEIDLDRIQAYFKREFRLIEADMSRSTLEVQGLYAIEDARRLKATLTRELNDNNLVLPTEKKSKFSLDRTFYYDEKDLMDAHVDTLLTLTEPITNPVNAR